jgi:hypothetical protein
MPQFQGSHAEISLTSKWMSRCIAS